MHDHSHIHTSDGIRWAFFLNLVFTIIEFIGGYLTNSTAIMADAVHDLGDSLSIGLAWVLDLVGKRKPDKEFSYGYRRFSLLGALINGLVLIVGSGWVLSIALPRLVDPQLPEVQGMFWLAILGVAVNGFAVLKLRKGKTLNEKVLNWHLLEDVFGWVAVLVVAIILFFFEAPILDPLLSIGFTLFILLNVLKNVFSTAKLFLQGVPNDNLRGDLFRQLKQFEVVADVHHLHLWSLDGEHHVLTAHLVIKSSLNPPEQLTLKKQIAQSLKSYELEHTTIELEFPEENCRDENG
ncbi:cation diffusion facilitator family transporter [Aurantivibrio infirmus]